MNWIADLHIHSHFSIATSKDCNPWNLHRWAGLKGINLVGSGDFTHPGWRRELREALIPAEPGFYRLKENSKPEITDQTEPRFIVSGELSTIYKQDGRVRKIHHLILLPSLDAADRIGAKLEEMGMNIRSDGRPILGISSYRLFELVLGICPEVLFIPAHIWTPHFSVFGSNSGFDEIADCYRDLTPNIFALETGLSSDPAMNWRWSALDRFTLVSNSDAHSPRNLAREANLLAAEFSYQGLYQALQNKDTHTFLGTIEFFPEEGKYHYDGHRACEVCWAPEETIQKLGICPVCGRNVTVGVLNRVVQLADRPPGYVPVGSRSFQRLVPLLEVIGSAVKAGSSSAKVADIYFQLLQKLGPELTVLREMDIEAIYREGGPLVAEAIRRLRDGVVAIKPGYDGEYGTICMLEENERLALQGQAALFEANLRAPKSPKKITYNMETAQKAGSIKQTKDITSQVIELSEEQLAIIKSEAPVQVVVAGPGTGKTRTLVERMNYLIVELQTNPAFITAVTFTNKAAAEIRTRLTKQLTGRKGLNQINIGTFHSLSWQVLKASPIQPPPLLNELEARQIVEEILCQQRIPITAREASLLITKLKNEALTLARISERQGQLFQAYQASLQAYQRWDFDDLILQAVLLWESDPDWLETFKQRFQHVLIDEFQDLSASQYRLVRLWAKSSRSLLAIGDPNQAIYGFRGASPHFFSQFKQDFPQTVTRQLSWNFRSPQAVLQAANALVGYEHRQINKACEATVSDRIHWLETPNEALTSQAVVVEINRLIGGSTMIAAHEQRPRQFESANGLYGLSDIAILYRIGRQAQSLERALNASGLPYRVVGQSSTLEVPLVKEFFSFCRYLLCPADLLLFRTALNYPRWELTRLELQQLMTHFLHNNCFDANWSRGLAKSFQSELICKLQRFETVVTSFRKKMTQETVNLIKDWEVLFHLAGSEELFCLKQLGEEYPDLKAFLSFLPFATEADISRHSEHADGLEMVTLSTLHAAKGLEFPVVFMVGVEEGLLPLGIDPALEAIAEEQRLFYVGVTRTQQRLYLANSQAKISQGTLNPLTVSRFLTMLPTALFTKQIWHQKASQLELF